MKHAKRGLSAVLACLLGLATACGESAEAPAVSPEPTSSRPTSASRLCRVVAGAEENNLLLADLEGSGEIYRLSLEGLTVQDEEGKPAQLENGMEVRVEYSGEENLTSPATFREPTALTVTGEKENLCCLYLQVLKDIWQADAGLNEGISQVGVDLSATSLSESEQAGVIWAFGESVGLFPLAGTYQELKEEGYITEIDGFPAWEDGCLLTIEEQESAGEELLFDAKKWRSGTGAILWTDCAAQPVAPGQWGEYQPGVWAMA